MAVEPSNRKSQLGFADRRHKIRRVTVEARTPAAFPEHSGRSVTDCLGAARRLVQLLRLAPEERVEKLLHSMVQLQ
jgi:hypothetical protein